MRRPDPAVALVWAGLTAAAALSAAAVEVYSESGTTCGGLLQPRDALAAPTCASFYEQREDVVRVLAVAAVALLALSVVSAVTRGKRSPAQHPDVEVTVGSASAAGVLGPCGYVVLVVVTHLLVVDKGGLSSVGLPDGWQHVGLAAGVVTACLVLRAQGLSVDGALAAAAVGVPALLLATAVGGHLLNGSDVDTSARLSDNPLVWVAGGVPTAVALLAVAALQRRGRTAPAAPIGAVLVLLSTGAATVALLPQVLPSRREARAGGPYPFDGLDIDLWLPLLVAPLVLSLLVVAAGSAGVRRPAER